MKSIKTGSDYARVAIAIAAILAGVHRAAAQGTAFTYQGQLSQDGAPANGVYDLTLSLFNAATGGSQVGATLTNTAVGVTNGSFSVVADFGAVFNGTPYWLQLGVETNNTGPFTPLSPRQALTPTPYAITAENVIGVVSLAQLPGSVVTNNEASVTLGNVTVSGNLTLPSTATISSGGGSLLHADGDSNFYAGPGAGHSAINIYDNTAIGTDALANNTGSYNVALGAFSLDANVGGSDDVAVGNYALADNASGADNVAVGSDAMQNNASGGNNVAVGYWALLANVSGFNNTANGMLALYQVKTGSNNLALGYQAGYNLLSGANNIYLANTGGSGDNNVIRIGTPGVQTATYLAGNVGLNAGLNVDENNQNNGNISANALSFGTSSGEGVASKRSGTNPYDLEFWTDFHQRMTILQNGNVGINTDNPTTSLDVNGEFLVVEGLTPARCYFGDDGFGNDVQLGSLASGVTAVSFYNATDNAYMHLFCSSITIEGGADLAEPFQVADEGTGIPQGAVVVIDEAHPGRLKISDRPYDSRVAGVVSGANGINPGIQMCQQGLLEGGRNVALTGRVYAQADASNGGIKPGDLLTTSRTPGRAMKVRDHALAQGAILGKAMTGLDTGKGMVLVLVTLQ